MLNEMLHGLSEGERIMIMGLTVLAIAAIVICSVMMLYIFRKEIKARIRYKLIKLSYELEMVAKTIERKLDMRESYEDFYTISDWARYAEFQMTKIPTWYQVVGQMLKGAYR